ncbi:hypothetical protein ACN3E9_00900 [Vibrio pectenicida]|uniref:hypothetical protein n=1 Tax=Vibrio pectenicida TaxID=62763 RepID=UPI003B9B1A01
MNYESLHEGGLISYNNNNAFSDLDKVMIDKLYQSTHPALIKEALNYHMSWSITLSKRQYSSWSISYGYSLWGQTHQG